MRPSCAPLLALGLLGCAVGLDDDEIAIAWGVTQSMLVGAVGGVEPGALDHEAICEEGGGTTAVGTLSREDVPNGTEQDIDVRVEFVECTREGVTTDGSVDWTVDQTIGSRSALQESTYQGLLTWGGVVESTCSVNLAAEHTTGEPVIWEGTICGRDAYTALTAGD